MPQFSANLGFLWKELSLPDAIRAAKAAGFHAVECHWPYDVAVDDMRAALRETGLPMLGINTVPGDAAVGERGLSAFPGRQAEARAAIELAVAYAVSIDAQSVHVMAGCAEGNVALETFAQNLEFAARLAAPQGLTILIEPLNRFDAPGYLLNTTAQAKAIIEELDLPNLKLMFDCYHVGRTEGDVIGHLQDLASVIGHIQFAAVPDRGPPDHGEVAYDDVFALIDAMGWDKPLGAEYRPLGATEASLGWLAGYL